MDKTKTQTKIQDLEDKLKRLGIELSKLADLLPDIKMNSLAHQIVQNIPQLLDQIKNAMDTGIQTDISNFVTSLIQLKKFLGDKKIGIPRGPGRSPLPPPQERYPIPDRLRPLKPSDPLPSPNIPSPIGKPPGGLVPPKSPIELLKEPYHGITKLVDDVLALLRELKHAGIVQFDYDWRFEFPSHR